MEDDLPPPDITIEPNATYSESANKLYKMIMQELHTRDEIKKRSRKKIEEFLDAIQSSICLDPSFIGFLRHSQKQQEILTEKYRRIYGIDSLPVISPEDVDEINKRIANVKKALPDVLVKKLPEIEARTNKSLVQIPEKIRILEAELQRNSELRQKLDDIKAMKANANT